MRTTPSTKYIIHLTHCCCNVSEMVEGTKTDTDGLWLRLSCVKEIVSWAN